MTDPEDTAEKNEQELNLFAPPQSDGTEPGDSGLAETSATDAATDSAADSARAFDAAPGSGSGENVSARVPAYSAASGGVDDSVVVAPPPPQRKPAAPSPRPGIVPPPQRSVSPASGAFRGPGNAAPAHKPLQRPIAQDQTLGQTLAAIRADRGLSLGEVAAATRIRQEYLVDLEADELLQRLPPVYISAYVRKLIDVYDIPGPEADALLEKMYGETPQDSKALPEKLIESVNDGALVDEGENKRIRKITIIFFSAVAIVAAAIVWLIVLVLVRYFGKPEAVPGGGSSEIVAGSVQPAEAPVPQEILLDESELDALIVPETPSITVLKMDKTPGVRDTP